MAPQTQTILCGSCRIPVEGPTDPSVQDTFSCPSCGKADTFDNVMASARAFSVEFAANLLQESIRKATRGSKIIKATLHPIQKGNYPFVVDIKL
jgi:hypothetical protein